ncbi:phosphoadenylyl-sulfate reductase [Thermoflexibacter ruber]|uniref:Adenosine 5'-phosphosulfate reductase n=1 Tax=Thermoflexibacter ruber TaxID=1003 RepID=A0A1I2BJY5_9BACT|nr:phosphoadenylyl-sulfate reductase [Thermoflexibacter ruber]SFE56475.1 phosphoadenylylsulfate reductase (thioredoxin) [Thermoflexibacter ruber]
MELLTHNLQLITDLQTQLTNKTIVGSLTFLAENFKGKVAFSTSLGQEDQVITDIIFKNNIDIQVFTLDTGRLFNQTYDLLDLTIAKYKKKIKIYFPDSAEVEEFVNTKGLNSFYDSVENRKACCAIRKVNPLKRALKDVEVWITGLRAEQSANRFEMKAIEWDNNFKLIKYNPLINWSLEKTISYLKENKVPYNPLHDQGFISIGCAPCTRAIEPHEDIRAGRWWWESSQKECGLHAK